MVSRIKPAPHEAAEVVAAGSKRWAIQILLSGVALAAGAFAPSGALAQCTGTSAQFDAASGLNALTSEIGTINTAFLSNGSAFVSAPDSAADQQGGGVWVRTIGGTVETQNSSNFSGSVSISAPAPYRLPSVNPVPISLSCNTKVGQDFVGFQAGHDIAFLNNGGSGANWHFGVLAGNVGSDAKSSTPDDTLKGNFEAPFAGLYTAFSKGNFFADAQARLDYVQGETLGERLDARGYSVTGNVGYLFNLNSKWTLEPSVGGVLSRTSADQFDVSGTISDISTPKGKFSVPAAGSLQIQDVESALGRASVKLGTSLALDGGQITAYPFVTASVFHEFAGDVSASVAVNGTVSPYSYSIAGNLTASRVGTYAQFGLGSAFQLAATGWLGYARVDYLTGDDIQGFSVNAGLRFQLNPSTASLKDGGGLKDGPAEGYPWTGSYVGASGGSTGGWTHWANQANAADPDFAGYLAGGQAGYNYQMGPFVLGVEVGAGSSNARGGKPCPASIYVSCEDDVEALGSLTARLGYTWGRALFYVKGGWAIGEVTAGESDPSGKVAVASVTKWENGWAAGGGMEFLLTEKWSAKAEYMHYELAKEYFEVQPGVTQSAATGADAVVAGLNYHLGR